MTRVEYFKQRNELIERAQSLLNEGKIEEFNAVKKEIEDLDNKYEEAATAQANLNALIDNVSIPAPIVHIQEPQNKVNINTLSMISLFCCKIRMKEIVISLTYVKRFKPTQRFRLNTKIRCNMIL